MCGCAPDAGSTGGLIKTRMCPRVHIPFQMTRSIPLDLNKLVARAKAMLLTPKTEWPVVATEPTTLADLYKGYIVPLAAIPAIFGLLSMSFMGTFRFSIGAGLKFMVLSYIGSLVSVYVTALIINALAPTFGGQKDTVQALKVMAFASTAAWVSGAGQIVPGIGWLIMIAGGIYSIYTLYLGLPHTMKCPPEKAGGYTTVVVIIAIVFYFVIGAVIGSMIGVGSMMRGTTFSSSDNADSNVSVDEDSALGRLEKMGKEMEAAG